MEPEELYGHVLAIVMRTPDDDWGMYHGIVQPLGDEVVLVYDVGQSRVLTDKMLASVKPVPAELADTLRQAEYMVLMQVDELPEDT